jgi:hypothetical protein
MAIVILPGREGARNWVTTEMGGGEIKSHSRLRRPFSTFYLARCDNGVYEYSRLHDLSRLQLQRDQE